MVAQAQFKKAHGEVEFTATGALLSGAVKLTPDGRAGIVGGLKALATDDRGVLYTLGIFAIQKNTSTVFLPGQEIWWDDTNNLAVHQLSANADWFLGICVNDVNVAAAATRVRVDLNQRNEGYLIDMARTGWVGSIIAAAGAPVFQDSGGEIRLAFSATAEVQMAAALSSDSIPVDSDIICEFELNVVDNGDEASVDINVGMANAGHASDAGSITESVFIHINGTSLDILAESDDGTTEVAETNTTIDYVEGTRFFVQMDFRDPADVQIFINGALILPSTAFKVDAATGPWKFLAHMEKGANDTPGEILVRNARVYRITPAS